MAQERDEPFLEHALRQGRLNLQDTVQFLHRYLDEGAPGEGIGHGLVAEGVGDSRELDCRVLDPEPPRRRARSHHASSAAGPS